MTLGWRTGWTHPAFWLATWGGVGLIRPAPGSWASLAALPFAYGLALWGGSLALALAALGLFFAGWWAASLYQRRSGESDPSAVVIDEVVGQWIALVPVVLWCDESIIGYGLAFAAFRLLDISKPWPVSLADRRHDGLGVMLDDGVAGALAGLLTFGLCRYVL
ncbi:MAG: phosphatidylglycerophosphatase A [Pseudomonadota bacterium]